MKVLILLCSVLLFVGCSDESNCIKSTGTIIKESRTVGNFATIILEDNIDLILQAGGNQSLEVEAGKNILDGITTEIKNHELTIKNRNRCNWLRSYDKKIKVYISQPNLVELYNLSYGEVTNTSQLTFDTLIVHNYGNGKLNLNIKCKKLRVDTNFFGDVNFSGEATDLWIHCFRLAHLDTRSLTCQNAEVLSDAEGDIYISAQNKITGAIRNSGNVYYTGNPVSISVSNEGEGKLIKQ